MPTLKHGNLRLAYRIGWYLLLRTMIDCLKLAAWLFTRTLLALDFALGMIASPLSSGRDEREFQDLVRPVRDDNEAQRRENPNAFWDFYYQAYTPRLWRMRRMFSMSRGRHARKPNQADED